MAKRGLGPSSVGSGLWESQCEYMSHDIALVAEMICEQEQGKDERERE